MLAGTLSGAASSMLCIYALSLLFGLSHDQYVTLLPKSITTAIGIGVSEELGGTATITVAAIIVTGIFGNMVAEGFAVCCASKAPLQKGLAIGSASHAIGTTRAMEMGEVEGGDEQPGHCGIRPVHRHRRILFCDIAIDFLMEI